MKVGLALGANVGDRLLQMQHARKYLRSLSQDQWLQASPVYATAPVQCPPGSPAFLNAVVEIEYAGAPRTLLKEIAAYETAQGRDRSAGQNGPRSIDIDILYFGDQAVCEKDLIIPHPRIADRRFVLVPLATICPDRVVNGTGRTVRGLLRELPDGTGEVKFLQQDW